MNPRHRINGDRVYAKAATYAEDKPGTKELIIEDFTAGYLESRSDINMELVALRAAVREIYNTAGESYELASKTIAEKTIEEWNL